MTREKLIKVQSKRRRDATELWLKVAADINSGLTPEEVRVKYVNPRTGKPYTREHIYWIVRELSDNLVIKINEKTSKK